MSQIEEYLQCDDEDTIALGFELLRGRSGNCSLLERLGYRLPQKWLGEGYIIFEKWIQPKGYVQFKLCL